MVLCPRAAVPFLLTLILGACPSSSATPAQNLGGGKGRAQAAFPVEVVPVESRSVEYSVTAVGSVAAFEEVQITARVAGVVEKVRFQEGESVKADEVLAEIDPDRFAAALDAARAAMQGAEVVQLDAETTLKRRQDAVAQSPGLYTAEDLQVQDTRVRSAVASVAAARANVRLAELNLRDARVRAPLAGVLQSRKVQTGQYVQPGAVLATLLRRDPLLLRFDVPEGDATRMDVNSMLTFNVRGTARPFSARISHVAGAASETTRMVTVTARVEDADKALLRPGSFAQVAIPVGAPVDAPVIPQTAVRPSEKGFLAYVIEEDVARERVLQLGMRTQDGKVEVKDGLKAGELLVVRGAEALREGAKVRKVAPGGAAPARGRETPVIGGGSDATRPDGGAEGRSL